ncbi:MAG: amidohydrolase [Limnochordaceae bacterium]|uniref:Amidohydrolase family protein n=1 Tax=Carboxydichorda subterranea TaxID=3109565 RepID=A0ABZ1BTT5_9FIRM|nr:amidohydrolase family protein [Limnochorda sp. L945t]MBE3598501.1 amidohydrolase [Limnochordaceae bacterium]WRP16217.1 amidohydrolase family protein [Limnochorda sp. L945t]
MRVLDFHAHFPHPDDAALDGWETAYRRRFGDRKLAILRERNLNAQREWWRRWSFPFPEAPSAPLETQVARWAGEVDRYGLDGVVFVTGGGNDALAAVVRRHPRFFGFAHHDPFAPDAAAELRRAIGELGLRGYKILAPALSGPIDDPALYPVWEAAEELGIPVLVHFGVLNGGGGVGNHVNIDPLRLHDVAKAFPTIPFVVPHFGCGYPTQLLHLCWTCENVYVDTSGNNEWMRWMIPELTLEELFRRFRETVGPHRIVFGTDSSHFPRGFVVKYLEEQLRACRNVGFGEAELGAVFSGNARRLLRIEGGAAQAG